MRLIVTYSVGDGYTYYATVTEPVIHESPESFIVEFEEKCKEPSDEYMSEFTVGGASFCASNFYERAEGYPVKYFYTAPTILTVDQYFEQLEK
jgi:hypothetical protein